MEKTILSDKMNQSVIDRIEIEMRQKRIMELREKVIRQQPPHIRAKYQTDHSSQQPLSVSQRDDGLNVAFEIEPTEPGAGTSSSERRACGACNASPLDWPFLELTCPLPLPCLSDFGIGLP